MTKPKGKTKLTPKKRLFVAHYLKNGRNASKAAIAAGYSRRSAGVTGYRLLKDAHIATLTAQALDKAEWEAHEVLLHVRAVSGSNISGYYDERGRPKTMAELTEAQQAAIQSVEMRRGRIVKLKLWNKPQVLDLSMKHFGLMKEAEAPPLLVPVFALPTSTKWVDPE